jgi:replicative DNA helicase
MSRRGFLGTVTGSALAFFAGSSPQLAAWIKAERSLAVEKALLSCLLIDPSLMERAWMELHSWMFISRKHLLIFWRLKFMHLFCGGIDFITLAQLLRDNGQFEECGGAAYLTEIFTFVPTAANYRHYVALLQQPRSSAS